jgi:hypothetical protein
MEKVPDMFSGQSAGRSVTEIDKFNNLTKIGAKCCYNDFLAARKAARQQGAQEERQHPGQQHHSHMQDLVDQDPSGSIRSMKITVEEHKMVLKEAVKPCMDCVVAKFN